jgi:hypothetical protein
MPFNKMMEVWSNPNLVNKNTLKAGVKNAMGSVRSAYGTATHAAFKGATGFTGSYLLLGGAMSAASYDPSVHNAGDYAAKEAIRTAGDLAMDTAMFATVPNLFKIPFIGLPVLPMAASMGVHMLGASLGTQLNRIAEEATAPKTQITQNENTLNAMKQSMQMLRQSSTANRISTGLGSEATLYHN